MLKGTLEKRLAYRKEEKFIIHPILPCGELHLVGGASGAGKTTWLLHWLRDWHEGRDVLGLRSYPVPFVYVSFDRGLGTLDRTLRRIRLDDWDFPAYDIADLNLKSTTLFSLVDYFPDASLYIIEGFQGCLEDAGKNGSQNKTDMLWAVKVRNKILSKGKTILGITHAPKMKKGENYISTRSRFLGTQSLLASTGTLISFDVSDVEGAQADDREVLIEGPNFPPITKYYGRNLITGVLEEKVVEPDGATVVNLEGWLDRRSYEELLEMNSIVKLGLQCGMKDRNAVNRWVAKQMKNGLLERVDEGIYRRLQLTVN